MIHDDKNVRRRLDDRLAGNCHFLIYAIIIADFVVDLTSIVKWRPRVGKKQRLVEVETVLQLAELNAFDVSYSEYFQEYLYSLLILLNSENHRKLDKVLSTWDKAYWL